jgi:hypothetical protein
MRAVLLEDAARDDDDSGRAIERINLCAGEFGDFVNLSVGLRGKD